MKTIMFPVITLLVLYSHHSTLMAQETNTAAIDTASGNALASVEKQLTVLKSSLDSLIHNHAYEDSVVRRSPYTVSIGASFDFIEGLKSSDIYAELSFLLLNLWGGVDQPWKSVGLYGGVYQGRSYFEEAKYTFHESYVLDTNPRDSVQEKVYRTVEQTVQSEAVNLSLYFSPTLRTIKYLYIAGHFEARGIDLFTFRTEDVLRSDTTQLIVQPDTSESEVWPYDLSYSGRTTVSYGEGFLGVGPLLYYTDRQVVLFLKTAFGIGFYGRHSTSTSDLFALFQFKVIEKSLGLRFGGEIRLLESDSNNSGSFELQMYLTKDFDLDRLRELFERD